MNWIDKLEKKFGRYAIHNLMYYVIILYALGYVINVVAPDFYTGYLSLDPTAILHGQIWRIVTFIIYPPSTGLFFFLISMYLYYSIGRVLEMQWGAFRFNLYLLTGMLLHVVAAFLSCYVFGANIGPMFGTYYLNYSLFFAFAATYPNMQFLLFFIIPVKAKWLAWIDAAYFLIAVFQYLFTGHPLLALIPIVAVLNYLLFFAADIGSQFAYWRGRAKSKVRQQQYKNAYQRPGSGPKVVNFHDAKTQTKAQYLHKCAVCGKTDLSDPQMEFRYCSKCNGYYCYCADHINNHIHIQ